ncbi:MAG: VOC family protein [Acidobacteriota bacterium]
MGTDFTRISRRRMMQGVAGVCVAGSAQAADAGLRIRGVDHVEFTVADVERSVAFYVKLFGGADVMKNRQTTRRYLKLGTDYIAIDRADASRVDHFCVGIEGFDIAALHAYLMQQGMAYRDYPSGKDLAVTDPDGARMQMAAADGWTSLASGTAAPEARAMSGTPIFRALRLDHVQLNAADVVASSAHYEKLLGVGQGVRGRLSFAAGLGSIRIQQTPEGRQAGVDHFCVRTDRFDLEKTATALESAGAKLEAVSEPGTVLFRDPDGFLVEAIWPL